MAWTKNDPVEAPSRGAARAIEAPKGIEKVTKLKAPRRGMRGRAIRPRESVGTFPPGPGVAVTHQAAEQVPKETYVAPRQAPKEPLLMARPRPNGVAISDAPAAAKARKLRAEPKARKKGRPSGARAPCAPLAVGPPVLLRLTSRSALPSARTPAYAGPAAAWPQTRSGAAISAAGVAPTLTGPSARQGPGYAPKLYILATVPTIGPPR